MAGALRHDDESRYELCVRTASRAGEMVRQARAEGASYRYKHGIELVSSADEIVERFICGEIARHFPGESILSEEGGGGSQADLRDERLWIVDPIDGTVNFMHGQDAVAIAIAYAERGVVRFGVVHAPFRNETFTATAGRGASRNGEPIRASNTERLRDALIGTGFPHDRGNVAAILPRLGRVLRACQDVRRLGSPALDICFVADGRLDGFYEGALAPWDVAAAALIASEAGAVYGHVGPRTGRAPSDLDGRDVVVAAPGIFNALVDLLDDGGDA
jgi:myo-inositol-1(or 4)-monophosphatase